MIQAERFYPPDALLLDSLVSWFSKHLKWILVVQDKNVGY